MRSKLTKAICLLICIVIVSLFGATPVSAESMEMTGHCQPYQDKASFPLCCLNSNYPLAYSSVVNTLPSPNRLAASKVIQLIELANQACDSTLAQQSSFQRYTSQGRLHPPGSDYRCRNSLESEEPPQI